MKNNRTVVEDLSQLPVDELNEMQAAQAEADADLRASVLVSCAAFQRLTVQTRRTGRLINRDTIKKRIQDVRKALDRVEQVIS